LREIDTLGDTRTETLRVTQRHTQIKMVTLK